MSRKRIVEEAKNLRRMWGGFWPARLLISANKLRVFDHLEKPITSAALSKKLRTDARATELLLNALVGQGLLKKEGKTFVNTPASKDLLVSKGPFYQGDIIAHADGLWRNWSGLDRVIKTGRPNRSPRKPRDQQAFIMGMHNIAVFRAGDVMDVVGIKGVKTALDMGGGPGTYSMEMARNGAEVTLFDLPETIRIAKRHIKDKRIKFLPGNFLTDDIGGPYDLVFISQILHSFPVKQCEFLIKKAKKSLSPGGRVVVQEFQISENLTYPPQSALFAINMLVGTDGGRCYSPGEIKAFMKKAGLKGMKHAMVEDTVIVQGSR